MLESRRFIVIVAMVLFAGMTGYANSAFAEQQDPSPLLKKAHKIKRLIKRGLVPYRYGIGVAKTGQTRSYATGDDGDEQRGLPWPEPRFVDHGDETVTDRATGLMWTKDSQPIPIEMNWYDAIKACNDFVFAGYDNWRMPNVRELQSLIDFGAYDPALPGDHPFTNVQTSAPYWSSTTSMPHSAQAWSVGMLNGNVRRYNKASSLFHVWPVRRGREHPR